MKKIEFKEIIKALRIEKGWTLSQLAKKLGVTPACVSYWESGKKKPSYDELQNLCVVLDVSGDVVLGFEEL